MRDAVILELANRWEHDAADPITENGSDEAQIGNAVARGRREAKRECVDGLRMLVQLLGDEPVQHREKSASERVAKFMVKAGADGGGGHSLSCETGGHHWISDARTHSRESCARCGISRGLI